MVDTPLDSDGLKLAEFVVGIPSVRFYGPRRPAYSHMGATITDACLQAGLRYDTVVAPRVRRLHSEWPTASTTSAFLDLIASGGLGGAIQWRHPSKLSRIEQLAVALRDHGVEREAELCIWLVTREASSVLTGLDGIGPKTVDYLGLLAGLQSAVAIDRHFLRALHAAGVRPTDYEHAAAIARRASEYLDVLPAELDAAIWKLGSDHVHFDA